MYEYQIKRSCTKFQNLLYNPHSFYFWPFSYLSCHPCSFSRLFQECVFFLFLPLSRNSFHWLGPRWWPIHPPSLFSDICSSFSVQIIYAALQTSFCALCHYYSSVTTQSYIYMSISISAPKMITNLHIICVVVIPFCQCCTFMFWTYYCNKYDNTISLWL